MMMECPGFLAFFIFNEVPWLVHYVDIFSDSANFPQRRIELRLESASTIDRGEIVRKEDEQRTDVTNNQCNRG